jgi:DNA-binding NarL/FixJ family response regulator
MAPNLRHAFAWFVAERDQEAALRMAVALQRYWRIRALWVEGRQAFAAAIALGEPEPTELWAHAFRGAAVCAELSFQSDAALDLNKRAIEIWEALDDRNGMAMSLIDFGNVNNNLGRFDDAIAAFEQAGELASTGALRTSLVARASMASAMLRKGALEDSDKAHRQMAPLLRQIDDPNLLATFLSNQAVVRQRLGDLDEAQRLLDECLGIQQKLGDDYGISVTLANLADIQRDPVDMERYASDSLLIATRIDAIDVIAAVSANLGDAALQRGDVSAAAERLIDALDSYGAIGDEIGQADVIGLVGASAIESDPTAATRLISAAQTIYVRNNVQPTSPQAMRASALQDRLHEMLGSDDFALAVEGGQDLSLDDAVLEAAALARTERALTPSTRVQEVEPGFGKLTPRELDVLRLIAAGKSNREIADTLFISVRTANTHVARILAKLECRNRAAAAALAYQHGLVPLP